MKTLRSTLSALALLAVVSCGGEDGPAVLLESDFPQPASARAKQPARRAAEPERRI